MKFYTLLVALLLGVSGALSVGAAPTTTLTADNLSYDGNTKIASASGNVVVETGGKTLTGATGWYNTATEDAYVTGGITVTGPDLSGRAATVNMYHNEQIVAVGNVYLKKGDREIYGDTVNFNTTTNYGVVDGNGKLVTTQAYLTAEHIEAWVDEIRAIGTGNVSIHSEMHNLNATGDRIDYHQTPNKEDGVAYLSGNAYAEQNGNTLQGNAFTITMEDNAIQTQGRSTLIIRPK